VAFSGINFRASSGYVTDGSGETYCLTNGANDLYPTTRGGLTFGGVTNFEWDSRDRNSGNDRRLAGMLFVAASGKQWKLDLPDGAGEYTIRIAVGDPDGGGGGTYTAIIKDGTTTLLTVTGTPGGNEFLDASSTVRTAAAWPGSNTTANITFSGTVLTLESGAACRIAHIAVEKVTGGGSTYTPRSMLLGIG
jgi:hypothetical protein